MKSSNMRFKYNGEDHYIDFRRDYREITAYDDEGNAVGTRKTKYPYTSVFIMKERKTSPDGDELVLSYTVGCYHRDGFTLADGRLAALRAVTKGLKDKLLSKSIWDAYLTR